MGHARLLLGRSSSFFFDQSLISDAELIHGLVISVDLGRDELGVGRDPDFPGAHVLGQMDTHQKGLVFGLVVGCGEIKDEGNFNNDTLVIFEDDSCSAAY